MAEHKGLFYYVVDIESTGLSAEKHRVTELSIVRVSDRFQLCEDIRIEQSDFANVSKEALLATGRTMEDLKRGKPALEVIKIVEDFINEDGLTPEHRCFVGHNIAFDRRFLFATWKRYGKVFPGVTWLDTMPFYKDYAQNYLGIVKPKKTLDTALEKCGIKALGTAHKSKFDTQNTYQLHKFLVKTGIDYLQYTKRVVQEELATASDNDQSD